MSKKVLMAFLITICNSHNFLRKVTYVHCFQFCKEPTQQLQCLKCPKCLRLLMPPIRICSCNRLSNRLFQKHSFFDFTVLHRFISVFLSSALYSPLFLSSTFQFSRNFDLFRLLSFPSPWSFILCYFLFLQYVHAYIQIFYQLAHNYISHDSYNRRSSFVLLLETVHRVSIHLVNFYQCYYRRLALGLKVSLDAVSFGLYIRSLQPGAVQLHAQAKVSIYPGHDNCVILYETQRR